MIGVLLCDALVAAPSPTTAVVLWEGHLEDAGGPVSRSVSALAIVRDAVTGDELARIDDSTLLLIDGDFFLDVPVRVADVAAPVAEEGASTVELIINGVTFPIFTVTAAWPRVARASFAPIADEAESADAIGSISDPVLLSDLAEGTVEIAFDNVTGVPPDFLDADGDGGLDFLPDGSFEFVDGTLALVQGGIPSNRVVQIDAEDLAADSVGAAQLAPGAVTAADVVPGSIPLSALAVDAVGATHLGTAATRIPVYEVDVANCGEPQGTLTFSPGCDAGGTAHELPFVGFVVFP